MILSPDMERTCCPQYTVRLDALGFKVGKKHRQVVNRFNRYIGESSKPGESSTGVSSGQVSQAQGDVLVYGENGNGKCKGKRKGKGKAQGGEWDLEQELKRYEEGYGATGVHRYTVCSPSRSLDFPTLACLELLLDVENGLT